MEISYNVSGKTQNGEHISGSVVINSQSIVNGCLKYSITNCQFFCNGLTCGSTPGNDAGVISIPLGQSQDTVVAGNGFWKLGEWVTDTGVFFKRVDGTYEDQLNECRYLPPLLELCCDNSAINSKGPFLPYGLLILTWNPHFMLLPVVKATKLKFKKK
jgi:hypothetical protein